MNVQLTPEQEKLVQTKVKSGRYSSASEVMSEALRQMEDRDLIKAEIRKKIAAGVASLRQGKGTDGEEFFAEMEAELDEEIRAEEQAERELAGHR